LGNDSAIHGCSGIGVVIFSVGTVSAEARFSPASSSDAVVESNLLLFISTFSMVSRQSGANTIPPGCRALVLPATEHRKAVGTTTRLRARKQQASDPLDPHQHPSRAFGLLDALDLAGTPGLVEIGRLGAVEAQDVEPALLRVGLDPVRLSPVRRFRALALDRL
jgi:hypothetical protein